MLGLLGLFFAFAVSSQQPVETNRLRAPAYPLITIDPYMSAWSFTDHLYGDVVRHWTGKRRSLIGVIRVDGKVYRFMGKEELPLRPIAPMSDGKGWQARYTLSHPTGDWTQMHFSDFNWRKGEAAFGTEGMPNLTTLWNTKDIWIRREVNLTSDELQQALFLKYSHDDVFELYINGKKVVDTGYSSRNDVLLPLSKEIQKALVKGKNIIAAHCENQKGGGYVDFGMFEKVPYQPLFDKTAQQTSVNVLPTQTIYCFNCEGKVNLKLTFTAPLLPSDLDLLSRPVDYISYQVKSMDQKRHDVQVYFEATPEWAVNHEDQKISSGMESRNGMIFLKTGTLSQNILGTKGDDVRMDWGYFYLVGKQNKSNSFEINNYGTIKHQFIVKGVLTDEANPHLSSDMEDEMTALGYAEQLGSVGEHPVSGYLMLGYDDIYSIQYFGQNLKAWWTNDGKITIADVFSKAANEYPDIMKQCAIFNDQLMQAANQAGGQKYADLCALAFRQSIAAHKSVKDKSGELLFFSKENFSNGSIGTVDVTYPSSPLFLYYNPTLLQGMMNPIFKYCESGRWEKPFAPHDMGTYPIANGQTYGDGMPIEESGNMLILTAAIAQVEGNADYAKKHWKMLSIWANYLLQNGLDPENQLCTDDFAGHFAHNANLSIKAILGIAAYGKLAGMLEKRDVSTKYIDTARVMAQKWVEMDQDGDHYRLTFDQPGTWSQKYNLVWDQLLELNVFPKEVAQKEVAYYLTKQNKYGLPLDSRKTYTKSDWIMWTATLAPDKTTFEELIDPVYRAFDETTSRVPMTDWYETTNARQVGFQARSVVGGYFMKMLEAKLHH